MRLLYLIILMVIPIFFCYSQEEIKQEIQEENGFKANEISLNFLYLITRHPRINYERLFFNNTGIGISILYSFNEEAINLNYGNHKYSVSPYYKLYFGKRNVVFLLQGGIELYKESRIIQTLNLISGPIIIDRGPTIGLGGNISLGSKYVRPRGWFCEILIGVTRGFINIDQLHNNSHGQFSISLGKRF